jgi:uncharacterized membrane protein YdcZ (DUF606 family)
MRLLGIELNAPSLAGLLRMLGFTLAVVALVEIVDSLTHAAWSSEASLSFIVGAFSGFLLTECGASFSKHGWRAFALFLLCGSVVFGAYDLVLANS